MLTQQQTEQMVKRKSNVAPITVYTNGNQYDAKRFIFNPRHVRTFDAFLDEITMQTNATCAVRRIYTPHGSRQVGALSNIEPGGKYVAVSTGNFKKIAYGRKVDAVTGNSSNETITTKVSRKHKVGSRLQLSYENQMKTQKTIYVYRNGHNGPPAHIFFTTRLLRRLDQVLDVVQEKITCERAVVSLHKLNGVCVKDVKYLEPQGRYVAVEQGQRFRHGLYDHLTTGQRSTRRFKLPEITTRRQRHPSNESSQDNKTKSKLKLPVIKENKNADFHITHGNTSHAGPFHASGAQKEFAIAVRDDRRVHVEKPLDMMPADEVQEELDGAGHHGNEGRGRPDRRVKPIARSKENLHRISTEMHEKESASLPNINNASKSQPNGTTSFPVKPSIAHPKRQSWKSRFAPKSVVRDQRFASQENSIDATKRYIVTREQRLFGMHGRDGRDQVRGAVQMYETSARTKEMEREQQEQEKRQRIEDWVGYTVQVKQKEDEIALVARQLVTTALERAGKSLDVRKDSKNTRRPKPASRSFYESGKNIGKYNRVFGI